MCSQTVLNEITSKVVQAARDSLGGKLDKVILYGSYARGDHDDESDIDIMVLANIPQEDAWNEYEKISKLISGIDLEYDVLVSVHVTSSTIFNQYLRVKPFYQNVMKDGVMLSA